MKVFVTKYALTKGITEREVTDRGDGHVEERCERCEGGWPIYYHKDDWCLTREAAVAKAEEMRVKRVEALKREIAKLEKMEFAR
jgi:hypothetical protein